MSGVTNNCAVASTIIESGRSDDDNDRDTDTPIYSEARHDPRSSTWKNRKREKEREGEGRERAREREAVNRRSRIGPPRDEAATTAREATRRSIANDSRSTRSPRPPLVSVTFQDDRVVILFLHFCCFRGQPAAIQWAENLKTNGQSRLSKLFLFVVLSVRYTRGSG